MTSFTCRGLEEVDPQSLGVTYWFDAAPEGSPYPVHVHISGRLRGQAPPGKPSDFEMISPLEDVVPGSGRISLSTRVPGLPPGVWDVNATPVKRASPDDATWIPFADPRLPSGTATGTTGFGPVIRVKAPGVRIGAWPALVGAGSVLALAVQSLLAQRVGLPATRLLGLSLVACLLGLLGAKIYYLATHPQERRSLQTSGMSVQGFVLVAVGTLLAGALVLGLPWRPLLDVTAPGLLFGMTVGRFGCFFGGCCAGRPTSSRWGIWSSDRRVGVRRVPVQLLESGLAAVVGGLAFLAVLAFGSDGRGLVFVSAIAAYVTGRQLLFPLRGVPRATRHGRVLTLVLSSLVTVGALIGLLV